MAKSKSVRKIEINLRNISQLFNSMDPSPFIEKDLDQDAEDFILSWAYEFSVNDSIALHIHLAEWPAHTDGTSNAKEASTLGSDPESVGQVRSAIHNYFKGRAQMTQMELRRLLQQGRTALIIGIIFLALCLVIKFFLEKFEPSHWTVFLKEGLTIAGWVAMWKPMQIYLYDWWPILRRARIFHRLSEMSVSVSLQKKGHG